MFLFVVRIKRLYGYVLKGLGDAKAEMGRHRGCSRRCREEERLKWELDKKASDEGEGARRVEGSEIHKREREKRGTLRLEGRGERDTGYSPPNITRLRMKEECGHCKGRSEVKSRGFHPVDTDTRKRLDKGRRKEREGGFDHEKNHVREEEDQGTFSRTPIRYGGYWY